MTKRALNKEKADRWALKILSDLLDSPYKLYWINFKAAEPINLPKN